MQDEYIAVIVINLKLSVIYSLLHNTKTQNAVVKSMSNKRNSDTTIIKAKTYLR